MKTKKTLISLVIMVAYFIGISVFSVSASDTTKTLDGKVYEFSKKNDYEIDEDNYEDKTSNVTTLGKLNVSGSISDTKSKDGITSYVVDDDKSLKIEYTCNDKYLDADKDEWHLTDDGDDEVNGIELDDDIDNGAIILETSLDNKNWHVQDSYVDVLESGEDSVTKDFKTMRSSLPMVAIIV